MAAYCKHLKNPSTCPLCQHERAQNKNREKMIAIPRSLLAGLVAVADEECSVGSPNHAHEVPGVWDSGNGEKSGQPCDECALYDYARKIVAETA